MKQFVDLNLRVPLNDSMTIEKMIYKAQRLGYNQIAAPLPTDASKNQINQLKQICQKTNLNFVSRTNLSPKNKKELLNELRKSRRKFEIIAVRCNTKDVARQAAKDRRVDLLQFSSTNIFKRYFDDQEAELASQALCGLEIELAPILQLTTFSRTRLLSVLRNEVELAERKKIPIILSSGATTEQLMRGPYDFAALTTIFDMQLSSALKALSETPKEIVKQNRTKLSPDYIAPGIKIVRKKNVD
jgi:RNase P/RNase MRP subunit p30